MRGPGIQTLSVALIAALAVNSIFCTVPAEAGFGNWLHRRPAEKESQPAPKTSIFRAIASWYGNKFKGHRTASGKPFNPSELTAASKTLPLGSQLKVKNPNNGKSCTVTINDRGPFVKGRSLDLSQAAANKIGLKGVQPVLCDTAAPAVEKP